MSRNSLRLLKDGVSQRWSAFPCNAVSIPMERIKEPERKKDMTGNGSLFLKFSFLIEDIFSEIKVPN